MYQYVYRFLFSAGMTLLLVCSIATNMYAQSQDSLFRAYNTQTIYTSGRYYAKGTEVLTFKNLKNEFNSGVTKKLYRQSKGSAVLSWALSITSVAALAAGAILRKNNDNKVAIPFSVGAIALNLGGLHFRKRSTQFLDRALWIRNKEVLFGVRQ